MSFYIFLKNKFLLILFNIICMVLFTIYSIAIDIVLYRIGFILLVWTIIVIIYMFCVFYRRKKYFKYLQNTIDMLDQKYLIAEILEKPQNFEDKFFYEMLRKSTKAMMEHITDIRHESTEYKEYIEKWVHEIKNPIASLKLKCENDNTGILRKVLLELNQIDNFVEQALFYARSENVDKDYFIKEVFLMNCVNAAVAQNKHILQNTVAIQIEDISETIYSDDKWLEFILAQLIINAVKYRKTDNPIIKIYTKKELDNIVLYIEDNGIGISESDLPRVFEKGFTGINGRNTDKSTGLGLYLCKKLCEKLGHDISIKSKQNQYSRVSLYFSTR